MEKQQIIYLIDYINKNADSINIEESVSELIKNIQQWDKTARAKQTDMQEENSGDNDNGQFAHLIRNLAVNLNNNYGRSTEALLISNVLKSVFAEIPEFAKLIDNDLEILSKIIKTKIEQEQDEQESLRRNRMDFEYTVTINADNIVVPPFCTCCMKPTESTEKVSTSVLSQIGIKAKTIDNISIEMPVCADCLQHRKKAARTKWLVILPAVAAAAASVPVYLLATGNSSGGVFWPIPFIIAVVAYLILGFIFKLPQLSAEHSTRQKSVQLNNSGQTDNKITYTFTNWHYAKIFAAANRAAITESPRRNRAKSLRFIKTIDYPLETCYITLIITIAVMFCFGNTLATVADTATPSITVADSAPSPSTDESSATIDSSDKTNDTNTNVTESTDDANDTNTTTTVSSPSQLGKTTVDSSTDDTSNSSGSTSSNKPGKTASSGTSSNQPSKPSQQTLDQLKAELSQLHAEIIVMEGRLQDLLDELDYYKQLYNNSPGNSTYLYYYNSTLQEYNQLYAEYQQKSDDYNRLLALYNSWR